MDSEISRPREREIGCIQATDMKRQGDENSGNLLASNGREIVREKSDQIPETPGFCN